MFKWWNSDAATAPTKSICSSFSWISSVENRICPRWTNSTLCFFLFIQCSSKKESKLSFPPSNLELAHTSEVAISGQKKLRCTLFKCSRELEIRTDKSVTTSVCVCVLGVITLHTHTQREGGAALLPPSVFSNVLTHMHRWFSRNIPWVCADIPFNKWFLIS